VAVYGLLPATLAFQPPVRAEPSVYPQLTCQPSIGTVSVFVIRIAAVKPEFHSLETMYSHFAALAKGVSDAKATDPTASIIFFILGFI